MANTYIRYLGGALSGGSGGSGVTSLNSMTGALTLIAGTGVTITPGVNSLTIASSGGGSGITALTGDVSATGPGSAAATVNSVGGASAANVASTVTTVAAATPNDTASTLMSRDSSGNTAVSELTSTGLLIKNATLPTLEFNLNSGSHYNWRIYNDQTANDRLTFIHSDSPGGSTYSSSFLLLDPTSGTAYFQNQTTNTHDLNVNGQFVNTQNQPIAEITASGSGVYARLALTTATGSVQGNLYVYDTSYSSVSGFDKPGNVLLQTNPNCADLVLNNQVASGNIIFAAGGNATSNTGLTVQPTNNVLAGRELDVTNAVISGITGYLGIYPRNTFNNGFYAAPSDSSCLFESGANPGGTFQYGGADNLYNSGAGAVAQWVYRTASPLVTTYRCISGSTGGDLLNLDFSDATHFYVTPLITGGFSAPSGSLLLPSYTFTTDRDTGFWYSVGGDAFARLNVSVTGVGTHGTNYPLTAWFSQVSDAGGGIFADRYFVFNNVTQPYGMYYEASTSNINFLTDTSYGMVVTHDGNLQWFNGSVTGNIGDGAGHDPKIVYATQTMSSPAVANPPQYSTSATSETINDHTSVYILEPASTNATMTITMPPNPVNGQRQIVAFGNVTGGAVTALTVAANAGQSLNSSPTSGPANTSYEWVYLTSDTTWYRLV